MNNGMLNLLSLFLGLVAWILPIFAIFMFNKNSITNCDQNLKLEQKSHADKNNEQNITKGVAMMMGSLISAIFSLLSAMIDNNYLVNIEDFNALLDTSDAFMFAAFIMVGFTIVLNIVAFLTLRGDLKVKSVSQVFFILCVATLIALIVSAGVTYKTLGNSLAYFILIILPMIFLTIGLLGRFTSKWWVLDVVIILFIYFFFLKDFPPIETIFGFVFWTIIYIALSTVVGLNASVLRKSSK